MHTRIHEVLALKGGHVEVIERADTVQMAVARMNEQHIGALLVVDGDSLIGILTERDLLVRVLGASRDPKTTEVHEVMSPELVVIRRGDTVDQAMRLASRSRCRHLPVVENGKLLGLVSTGDLNAWLVRKHEQTIADLHDYITR